MSRSIAGTIAKPVVYRACFYLLSALIIGQLLFENSKFLLKKLDYLRFDYPLVFLAVAALYAVLHDFKRTLSGTERMSIGYEEQFHQIMQALLEDQLQICQEVESLKAARKSTREELYRRVNTANEFIRAYFDRPVKLDDIAAAACLSPNHLLRTYQQIYKRTPHQHITEFRIQKARQLLSETDYTMTEITFLLGLQNPASFSKLFKQFAGISPADYRKKVRMDKTR